MVGMGWKLIWRSRRSSAEGAPSGRQPPLRTGERRNCPPIDLISSGTVDPGKVFDLTLPLDQVSEGYRAMDERRAIKTLLRP
jgi:threonine dehydrogenase-like Zn-dependent dehydrogenase